MYNLYGTPGHDVTSTQTIYNDAGGTTDLGYHGANTGGEFPSLLIVLGYAVTWPASLVGDLN